jgi:hypothetical protein
MDVRMVGVVSDPTAVLVFMDSLVHNAKEVTRSEKLTWKDSILKSITFLLFNENSPNEMLFLLFDYVKNLNGKSVGHN